MAGRRSRRSWMSARATSPPRRHSPKHAARGSVKTADEARSQARSRGQGSLRRRMSDRRSAGHGTGRLPGRSPAKSGCLSRWRGERDVVRTGISQIRSVSEMKPSRREAHLKRPRADAVMNTLRYQLATRRADRHGRGRDRGRLTSDHRPFGGGTDRQARCNLEASHSFLQNGRPVDHLAVSAAVEAGLGLGR